MDGVVRILMRKKLITMLMAASIFGMTGGNGFASDSVFSDKKCGFQFTYPSSWTITTVPLPSDSVPIPCKYAIDFKEKSSEREITLQRVEIEMSNHMFRGFKKEGFSKYKNQWYQGTPDEAKDQTLTPIAEEIHGMNWRGMSIDSPARCYDEKGYIGAGETESAVLYSETFERMFTMDDGGECKYADEAIKAMLATFTFTAIGGQ